MKITVAILIIFAGAYGCGEPKQIDPPRPCQRLDFKMRVIPDSTKLVRPWGESLHSIDTLEQYRIADSVVSEFARDFYLRNPQLKEKK